MNQSEHINELASALSKAQGEIIPAMKDSSNPFFKSKYADLSSVWNACKKALAKNNLAVLQTMEYREEKMFLITTLAHSSGQWMKSCVPVTPVKNDPQGIGSAMTYMRRYSLASIVGVTTDEDDDGNAASFPSNNSNSKKYTVAVPKEENSTITSSQAKELKEMMSVCDDSYEANFWAFLKKEANGITRMEDVPASMYQAIKKSIIKHREGHAETGEHIYA